MYYLLPDGSLASSRKDYNEYDRKQLAVIKFQVLGLSHTHKAINILAGTDRSFYGTCKYPTWVAPGEIVLNIISLGVFDQIEKELNLLDYNRYLVV